MNKQNNIDLSKLGLDDLIAMRQAENLVREQSRDVLEAIAAFDAKMIDAKNVADDAKTTGNDLWSQVWTVTRNTFEATQEAPETRHAVITAVLKDYLDKTGPDGKKAKPTTAGQYASTARSFLSYATETGIEDMEEYADAKRSDVMEMMRDKTHAELLKAITDAAKLARFIVKNGDPSEHKALTDTLATIAVIYGPIKARKDGNKAAAVGARELAELRQNHPAAPGVVETVAAMVADGETGDKAARKIEMLEDLHNLKQAV